MGQQADGWVARPRVQRVSAVESMQDLPGQEALCPPDRRLLRTHLLYPLLLFLLVAGVVEHFHLDLILADALYHLEGDRWALKKHFITATVVHEYGRHVVQLLVLLSVGLIIRDWRQGRRRQLAADWYLFACFAITTLTVSLLRHLTHVTCPWDLLRYGGDTPYVSIFARLPPGTEAGACFPAGHASGAYAWVALYYYFRVVSPRYRWYGLAFGLMLWSHVRHCPATARRAFRFPRPVDAGNRLVRRHRCVSAHAEEKM